MKALSEKLRWCEREAANFKIKQNPNRSNNNEDIASVTNTAEHHFKRAVVVEHK